MIFMDGSILNYFDQSPIIPFALSLLITIIIIMQCFSKHMFFKVRLLLSFLLVFSAGLCVAFHKEIQASTANHDLWVNLERFGLSCHQLFVFQIKRLPGNIRTNSFLIRIHNCFLFK